MTRVLQFAGSGSPKALIRRSNRPYRKQPACAQSPGTDPHQNGDPQNTDALRVTMVLLPFCERSIIPPMKSVQLLIVWRLLVCSFAFFVCSGCVVVDRATKSDAEMKEQIVDLVPIGTAIAEAQRTMERNGYRCSSVPKSKETPARLVCQKEKQTSWV